MPVLQFSAAMLAGLLSGNQADSQAKGDVAAGNGAGNNGKASGTDQFSSLLNVLGNAGDADRQPQPVSRKDEAKDPAAVAVDAPGQFRAKADNNSGSSVKKAAPSDDGKKAWKPEKPAANPKDNDKAASGPQRLSARPEPASNDKKPAAPAADAVPDKGTRQAGLENDGLEDLKEKISGNFGSLDNLLDIIAQWLAGANSPVTAQAGLKANIVTQSDAAGANDLLNAGASGKVPDPLAVFAALKTTLAQLQQFLQAAGGQEAPLSKGQNAQLMVINNALQGELNALKTLLPQPVNGDGEKAPDSGVQNLPIFPTAGDNKTQPLFAVAEEVKPLLQKDISLIKDMLQKFKDDRTLTPAKPEVATSSPLPAAQPAAQLVDAPVDNNMPVGQEARKPEPAVFSNAAAIPAIEQNISQQVLPQQSNIPVAAAPVAAQAVTPAIETQTNSSSNFGGNSGQGGNAQAQLAVNAAGATSTQAAAGGNNETRFSSFLNRTGQAPVTEQVAFQVKAALGSGNSKITIQLHPEDLGKLDITLDVDAKGKTGVTITTDNKHTLDLLQRDSQGLQKALADAGLKADTGSLSFNLRGGQQEGQGQNQSQAASQYRKSQPDELPPENLNIASVTRSYVINLPNGLDIKI